MDKAEKEMAMCATIAKSGLFDSAWYLRQYPDVLAAGIDPILHYVRYGEREGRKPSADLSFWHAHGDTMLGNKLYEYIAGSNRKSIESATIPIVFACNEKYAPYLSVAIASLAANADPGNDYTVYIFYNELTGTTLQRLCSQATSFMHIIPLNVAKHTTELVENAAMVRHLTHETYFRILMPKLLPQHNKVVYLDCDIVINTDIAKIYSFDVSHSLLGAVHVISDKAWLEKVMARMGKTVCFYFNTGVLLINNFEFIKRDIFTLFMQYALSGKEYICADQDILNIICDGKVKKLPRTWNYGWFTFCKGLFGLISPSVLKSDAAFFKKPNIVHFVSEIKPIHENDGHFAPMFWHYAHYSPFFEYLKGICKYNINGI